MIKLIISDLDGTIIRDDNRCDPSTPAVLRQLRPYGVRFAVCTGRPVSSMKHMIAEWGLEGLTDYIIGSNGGEVFNTATGETDHYNYLSVETIRDIIDLYEPLGLIPALYDGPVLYVQKITDVTTYLTMKIGVEQRQGDIRTLLKEPQAKYLMPLPRELMPKTEQFIKDHPDPRYIVFKSATVLVEMTDPSLNKGTGLEHIMEKEGITADEVIAFGDMPNDIPMLKLAKYSVCMETGSPDTLEAARYTAKSVLDNGFADWLQEHLRGNEIIKE